MNIARETPVVKRPALAGEAYNGETRNRILEELLKKHEGVLGEYHARAHSPAEHFLILLRRRIDPPAQRVLAALRQFIPLVLALSAALSPAEGARVLAALDSPANFTHARPAWPDAPRVIIVYSTTTIIPVPPRDPYRLDGTLKSSPPVVYGHRRPERRRRHDRR